MTFCTHKQLFLLSATHRMSLCLSATYKNTFLFQGYLHKDFTITESPTGRFIFGNITHRTFCLKIKKDWIAQKRLDLHESTHERGILSKTTRRRTEKTWGPGHQYMIRLEIFVFKIRLSHTGLYTWRFLVLCVHQCWTVITCQVAAPTWIWPTNSSPRTNQTYRVSSNYALHWWFTSTHLSQASRNPYHTHNQFVCHSNTFILLDSNIQSHTCQFFGSIFSLDNILSWWWSRSAADDRSGIVCALKHSVSGRWYEDCHSERLIHFWHCVAPVPPNIFKIDMSPKGGETHPAKIPWWSHSLS